MAKRTLSHVLIIIGAALLVAAVLLPSFLVPKLRVIPLDTKGTTVTNVDTEGYLLDSAQLAKGEPTADRKNDPRCKVGGDVKGTDLPLHCFIGNTPMLSNRHVRIQEPSDKKVATMEVGTVLLREDREEPKNLVNASVDRIPLDRSTAFPINEATSTVEINAPDAEGKIEELDLPQFVRDGIQYQFPFGTEKKSYPYFDVSAMESFPIDFVGEEKQDGTTVYKFEMKIGPINLYDATRAHFTRDGRELTEGDKASLASLKLKFPAKTWGLEGDEDVEMTRYYTNVRTVRVEPTSGMIVNGTEKMFQYYARDDKEAQDMATGEGLAKEQKNRDRTALEFMAQWDDKSMAQQLAGANEAKKALNIAGTIAPWAMGIIGLLLVVFGIRSYRKA